VFPVAVRTGIGPNGPGGLLADVAFQLAISLCEVADDRLNGGMSPERPFDDAKK